MVDERYVQNSAMPARPNTMAGAPLPDQPHQGAWALKAPPLPPRAKAQGQNRGPKFQLCRFN